MLANMKVCGNILSTDDYNIFALRCESCEEAFHQWPIFIKHLKNAHKTGENHELPAVLYDTEEYQELETLLPDAIIEEIVDVDEMKDENGIQNANQPIQEDVEEEEEENFQEVIIEADDDSSTENLEYLVDEIDDATENNNCDFECEEKTAKPIVFRFNLQDASLKEVSLKFLKLLKEHPSLWNKQHEDYRKAYLKVKALKRFKYSLKNFGYTISDAEVLHIIRGIIRDYARAQTTNELDAQTQYFIDECKFLHIALNKQNNTGVAEGDGVNISDKSDDEDEISKEDLKYFELEQKVTTSYSHSSKRSYKRIRFNVPSNNIALEFIELLKNTPVLWNTTTRKSNSNLNERKKIVASLLPHFQSLHNIDFTYEDISLNFQHLRRYYYDLVSKSTHKHLDYAAKQLIELCSFLPQRRSTAGRIKCKHCDNFFLSESNYQAHLFAMHNIGESPFKCNECGKHFSSLHQCNLHIKQVHAKKFDFPCTYCDRSFLQPSNLQMHLAVHTGEKKFVCELCGKAFRRRVNLKYHETRIHLRQRNFACNMCPKAFYTKSLLKDHMNVHLDIRNSLCPFCGKGFHSSHSLMRHKQIHSSVKRYACTLCDSRFHQFVGLSSHMKNRHKYVSNKIESIPETEVDSSFMESCEGEIGFAEYPIEILKENNVE